VQVAVTHDFETVFREVYPRLVSLGRLQTGRADIARELAQETMLRAHARWGELATYDAPDAWCRTVMTNLLIDHHRSTAAERRAVERLGHGAIAAPPDPVTPALDRWHALVAPLPERQRTIVTLYYADDLDVGRIADLLGMSNGAVKAALFKARRTLRRRLADEAAPRADRHPDGNGDQDGDPS
jgi:RNA polymerase sigma-70 factor (ECF subfamily)